MDTRKSLLVLSFCFALAIGRSTDCKCPGPIKYYQELGCMPVYQNADDCCPVRYDCDHLKNLPEDRCFVNGHAYEVGEALRDEDANPCDINCFCAQGDKRPKFICAVVDCFHAPVQEGCYLEHKADHCCPGPQICPENDKERAICVVDGKTYREGDYFEPEGEPKKSCYCAKGYTGENVEPFCRTLKNTCGVFLHHAEEIYEKCIPTYYYSQSPRTDCSVAYRCQNNNDTVIPQETDPLSEGKSATTEPENPEMKCIFGDLSMNINETLNQATDYSSVCVKCVCEVPPIPTCQRLSDEECDVTNHPDFNRR